MNVLPIEIIDGLMCREAAHAPAQIIRQSPKSYSNTHTTDVWAEIERVAGVVRYTDNGWSNYLPCPSKGHDQDITDPKFGLHQDGYGHCFKCGQTWNSKQLAEKYRIPWPEYSRHQSLDIQPADAPTDSKATRFRNGLPSAWRGPIRKYAGPNSVVFAEMLYRGVREGIINAASFTVPDLEKAALKMGFAITQPTLYRQVEKFTDVFFSKLDTKDKERSAEEKVSSSEKKSRGRKPDVYSLLPLSQVESNLLAYATPPINENHHPVVGTVRVFARPTAKMIHDAGIEEEEAATVGQKLDQVFAPAYARENNEQKVREERAARELKRLKHNLKNYYSTQLPDDMPLASPGEYLAAFARAYHSENAERRIPRQEWCAVLGVGNGSLGAILARAGLYAVKQREHMPVTVAHNFEQQVRQFGMKNQAFPLWAHLEGSDGTKRRWRYEDVTLKEVEQSLQAGASVVVEFQAANKYTVKQPAQAQMQQRPPHKRRPIARGATVYRKHFYGPNYDLWWLQEQLKLGLERLGWIRLEHQVVNPDTKAIAPDSPGEIIEMLIGRRLAAVEEETVDFSYLQEQARKATPYSIPHAVETCAADMASNNALWAEFMPSVSPDQLAADSGKVAPDRSPDIIEVLIGGPLKPENIQGAEPPVVGRQRTHTPPGEGWREIPLPKVQPRQYVDLSKLRTFGGKSKYNPFSKPESEADM